MLKHMLVGAVLTSSVALADHGYRPAAPAQPPPGVAINSNADDRIDVMRATRLLSEFEAAAARRDRRAMASVDARFQAFVNQELAELRMELGRGHGKSHGRGRGSNKSFDTRRTINQLETLQLEFARLAGRVDRMSVSQKRTLYTQARAIAQADLFDNGHRRG